MLAGVFLALPLAMSTGATAGPFDGFSGVWGGTGTVVFKDGNEESLSCRVQYFQPNDDNLQQAMRCATGDDTYQINAVFIHKDGAIRGRWWEKLFNVTGKLTGTVGTGRFDGSLSALGHSADLTMSMTDNQQTVTIVTTTDLPVKQVDVEFRR